MQAILTGMGAKGTGHAQEHVLDGIFAALVGGNNLGRFKPRHIKRLCIQCRSNFSSLRPSCVCFGWGPRHQTTDARVLAGAPGTKPQAHVLWVGPPAPNHRRTCFGWDYRHPTCWDPMAKTRLTSCWPIDFFGKREGGEAILCVICWPL